MTAFACRFRRSLGRPSNVAPCGRSDIRQLSLTELERRPRLAASNPTSQKWRTPRLKFIQTNCSIPFGRARWWMGGKPLDMTGGGSFVVDHASCDLAASVSLKRTFLSCLAMSLAVSALAVLVYDDANWPELGFMVCWPSVGCGVATTIGHNERLPNTWGQSHKPPKGRFPPKADLRAGRWLMTAMGRKRSLPITFENWGWAEAHPARFSRRAVQYPRRPC